MSSTHSRGRVHVHIALRSCSCENVRSCSQCMMSRRVNFYDDEEISTPNLTIPHYDWKNRDFFIACLEEISCPFVEGNGLSLKKVKKLV